MGQMEKANRRQGCMSQREGTADAEACRKMETEFWPLLECVCHVENNDNGDNRVIAVVIMVCEHHTRNHTLGIVGS